MFKVLPGNLPKDLTSYDFLKAIAIILMITDHVGYHFYPDEAWFRIFGRLCVPIWFFLIGYARTREIPKTIWIWAGALVVSSMIAGQFLFPVTVLFSLMLARHWIDGMMVRALRNYEAFAGMFFLLLCLSWPSGLLFEYGTLGFMFTIFGALMRNRKELEIKQRPVIIFVAASAFTFFLFQGLGMPHVSPAQGLVLFGGVGFVCWLLYVFRPATYPRLTQALPGPVIFLIQLMGRRTLEIYVLHILLFRGLAMILDPERFGLYEWRFFPPGASAYLSQIIF